MGNSLTILKRFITSKWWLSYTHKKKKQQTVAAVARILRLLWSNIHHATPAQPLSTQQPFLTLQSKVGPSMGDNTFISSWARCSLARCTHTTYIYRRTLIYGALLCSSALHYCKWSSLRPLADCFSCHIVVGR